MAETKLPEPNERFANRGTNGLQIGGSRLDWGDGPQGFTRRPERAHSAARQGPKISTVVTG